MKLIETFEEVRNLEIDTIIRIEEDKYIGVSSNESDKVYSITRDVIEALHYEHLSFYNGVNNKRKYPCLTYEIYKTNNDLNKILNKPFLGWIEVVYLVV